MELTNKVDTLVERLENYYDFQCEGGPLRNCVEWQQLKVALTVVREALETMEVAIRAELTLSPHLPKLTQRAIEKWADQLAALRVNTA